MATPQAVSCVLAASANQSLPLRPCLAVLPSRCKAVAGVREEHASRAERYGRSRRRTRPTVSVADASSRIGNGLCQATRAPPPPYSSASGLSGSVHATIQKTGIAIDLLANLPAPNCAHRSAPAKSLHDLAQAPRPQPPTGFLGSRPHPRSRQPPRNADAAAKFGAMRQSGNRARRDRWLQGKADRGDLPGSRCHRAGRLAEARPTRRGDRAFRSGATPATGSTGGLTVGHASKRVTIASAFSPDRRLASVADFLAHEIKPSTWRHRVIHGLHVALPL